VKSKIKKTSFCHLISLLSLLSIYAVAAKPSAPEATITSDELEIRHNGEETFFRGHVVLTDTPYVLNADRMLRVKTTGIVTAGGHLEGAWLSEKGEKINASGNEGRYEPQPPRTELWGGKPELVRWETAADTTPVHITADRFIAEHEARQFYALGHVVITQKPKVLSRSDKARYDQKAQTIHLYGPTRVFVHISDAKGVGEFTAEKGWVTLAPKTAHMAGHVLGHIDPSQTL
jgi:lipopolysaccharide export system protein LptA